MMAPVASRIPAMAMSRDFMISWLWGVFCGLCSEMKRVRRSPAPGRSAGRVMFHIAHRCITLCILVYNTCGGWRDKAMAPRIAGEKRYEISGTVVVPGAGSGPPVRDVFLSLSFPVTVVSGVDLLVEPPVRPSPVSAHISVVHLVPDRFCPRSGHNFR